ncbi:MAG: PAS domain S-box protein, partial [Deltaproteobacteria bacterium]|nr:PAS domain S-box protein [Deltaproteobacteria bacterium]
MDPKPTYEDLEQRVKELEAELVETNRHQDRIRDAEGVLALLRMSPYGIFIIDLSGKVLFANEMGAERLGTTVKEIIGTTLRDYFPPDIAENRRLRGIEAVRSGRRQQFEDQVGDRWYHSAICPIRDEAGRPTSLAIYSADITDRKRLEEALREREEQFRQVTETIREVFWLGSMDWARIYYISPAYEHVWGRSCEEVYERPMSWLDSVLEEDRETITASIPEVMTKDVQEIVFPDYRIRRPDGSVAWISARAFPVLDSSGRPYRIAGIAEDVSDRKRAEEALRESEAQLKSTFLAAPVGICIMKNRVYERANVFWCERFGYPEKDILGRTTRMLYESEEEYERVGRELYANLLEQGLSSTETRLRRSDGVYRDVTVTAAPLHSDDLTAGTVVVVHDVTERMRAEKALRESEERFRRLAEYSPFGLSIMNRDETFEYFNIKFTE